MSSRQVGSIPGFSSVRLPGSGVEIDTLVGGAGPPLLLLHGYPQTRVAWRSVAPTLARAFTVVVPDLRGYGRSDKPTGDAEHRLYSKRAMALDQLAVMAALGHERFAVAGHDRGARVAYRLGFDHPDAVSALAVLDIVPTAAMWTRSAMTAYHWSFLAQPFPLPETLIGSQAEFYLRWTLRSWAARGFVFDEDAMRDYIDCFNDPESIHATCEDYRAGWTRDREHDDEDHGVRRLPMPLLALWGEAGGLGRADAVAVWSEWADDVRGHAVPGGHFLCEEAPGATSTALVDFFVAHQS